MKALLDTNILIHREAATVTRKDIGNLFRWLDRLHYEKCVHPISIAEIRKHGDPKVVAAMEAKVGSYELLKSIALMHAEVVRVGTQIDTTVNDANDTRLLNEAFTDRVDIFISEDKKVHAKAQELGISAKVLSINEFLEKAIGENPGLVDYKTLSVRQQLMGDVDLTDSFFDQFKVDYPGFESWFVKKSQEIAYVAQESGALAAFLYLKFEPVGDVDIKIVPHLPDRRKLKIGTMKVTRYGQRLGERFLKIVFDNAIRLHAEYVYVTVFEKRPEQLRLIQFLKEWGFKEAGRKEGAMGSELVLARSTLKAPDAMIPRHTYPALSACRRTFLVPIYPEYHTELFPDSILNTESPQDFVESEPHRNAIAKIYISRSKRRDLAPGDNIVFYRTGDRNPKIYSSVVTTIGVVESVIDGIESESEFISLCQNRSVFSTPDKLVKQWNYNRWVHPFIVNFLFAYSFPHRINLHRLIQLGIVPDVKSVPRGFELITNEQFRTILRETKSNESLVFD